MVLLLAGEQEAELGWKKGTDDAGNKGWVESLYLLVSDTHEVDYLR